MPRAGTMTLPRNGNAINLRPNTAIGPTNVGATARNDSGVVTRWDLITYALCAV